MWEEWEARAIKNWDDLLCLASNLFFYFFIFYSFDSM